MHMLAQAITADTAIQLQLVIVIAGLAASGLTAFIVQRTKLQALETLVTQLSVEVKLNSTDRLERAAIARHEAGNA